MDERTTRSRDQSLATQLASLGPGLGGRIALFVVVTTKVTTYPTVAQSFYAAFPVTIGGTEGEGSAFTKTPDTTPIYVANIGTAIPPVGTYLVANPVDGRAVVAYYGASS